MGVPDMFNSQRFGEVCAGGVRVCGFHTGSGKGRFPFAHMGSNIIISK